MKLYTIFHNGRPLCGIRAVSREDALESYIEDEDAERERSRLEAREAT